ncbi:hypothetical protein [Clostridium sp.]|uniref:hypothetical protein n=1 Tax=Clostridium sp. TaxID=1506 RepID=UPI003F3DAFD5
MNFRELKLEEGKKYTIVFYDGLTGITTAKITLVDYYISNYAQYEECLYLEVKIGRKRYIREVIFTPNQPLLIGEGWETINFDSLYIEEERNGVTHKYSKILSQSKEWIECAYKQLGSKSLFYKISN